MASFEIGLLYMHKGQLLADEEDFAEAIDMFHHANAYLFRAIYKELKETKEIDEAFEKVKACQTRIEELTLAKTKGNKAENVSIVVFPVVPEIQCGKNSDTKNDIVKASDRLPEEIQESNSRNRCFKTAENLAERAKYEDDYGCLQTAMKHYDRAAVLYRKSASGPNINTTDAINKMERCLIRRDFLGGVLRRHQKRHLCNIL